MHFVYIETLALHYFCNKVIHITGQFLSVLAFSPMPRLENNTKIKRKITSSAKWLVFSYFIECDSTLLVCD